MLNLVKPLKNRFVIFCLLIGILLITNITFIPIFQGEVLFNENSDNINLIKFNQEDKFFNKLKKVIDLLLNRFDILSNLFQEPRKLEKESRIWTTDEYGYLKTEFAPEEIVYIHGSGFLENFNINIDILRPDGVIEFYSALSDIDGSFSYNYNLNGILGKYSITAYDGTNSADTIFYDALRLDFKQYATKNDLWINSVLQQSNSEYYECMSVPQRTIFESIPATSGDIHTLTISHQATKRGTHAYDWLTAWNQGNNPPLNYIPCGENIPNTPVDLALICENLHSSGYTILVDVPDDPFLSKDDIPPTITTQTRIDAYEATYGNRQIKIYGNQPFTNAYFSNMYHDVSNYGDTGDSSIYYELTWISASDQIIIEMAGHLSLSGDPNKNSMAWGIGLGAGQIQGGPYHFKLSQLDGKSLGSQDNQIKGADILIQEGCLEVTKDVNLGSVVNPSSVTETFEICITGPSYPSGNCKTISEAGGKLTWNNLIPGSYTITETNPGPEWTVTGSPQTITVNPETPCATATVTNTFVPGCLVVTKDVVNPDGAETFEICITGPSYPSGNCKTISEAGGTLTWNNLIPGSYTITETNPGPEWTVTGSPQTVTVNPGTPCATATVTNTYNSGCLEVTKDVNLGSVVNPSSVTETFEICITGPSYPSGNCKTISEAGGTLTWNNLIPGSYTITETNPGPEWTVTGSPQTVTVNPGTPCATATVTNTYNSGCLEVTKDVNLGSVVNPSSVTETFEICITGPSYPSGNCKTISEAGGKLTWNNLIPGSYTITETNPGPEWTVTGSPQTITVNPETPCATATVTNTFVPGCLVVTKDVVNPDGAETFEICITGPSYPSGNCKTISEAGGTLTWNNLIPGSYTITETNPGPEWTVTGSPQTVTVNPGTPCATATVTNTYNSGCLEVTKDVNLGSVVNPSSVTETFEICITGPSYPSGNCKTISEAGGTLTWNNLIPGSYTITETNPGPEWTVTGSPQTVTVNPGTPCATATVTNTYNSGCLEITKTVDWRSVTPDTGQTFTVTVTGPSCPSPGITHVFDYDGDTWTLNDLIQGSYTIVETDPGSNWVVTPSLSQTVTVNPGTECGLVTITNTLHCCLEITKIVDWSGATPDPSQTFTVTVTGPSYPSPGISHVFGHLGGTWTLPDLIPGSYTVVETDPGTDWVVTGSPQTATVNPGPPCAYVEITNTYFISEPSIDVEKYVSVDNQETWHDADDPTGPVTIVGNDVYFKFVVTNTGNVALTSVSLTDSDFILSCTHPTTLQPGEFFECYHGPVTAIAGQHTNCATVYGECNPIVSDLDCANYLGIEPCIEIDKKVWNETYQEWVDEIRVPKHSIVKFKITIQNCGDFDLHDLDVIDTLSMQLAYADNANYSPYSVSSNVVKWHFPIIDIGEKIEITFDAETIHVCYGWNKVVVTTAESIIDEDIVTVKVFGDFQPIIDLTKEVWDEKTSSWVDSITCNNNSELNFKITINSTSLQTVHDVNIIDILPPNLEYLNIADPLPSNVLPGQIEWYFDSIDPGEIITIIYSMKAIHYDKTEKYNLGNNHAKLTTYEGYGDEDYVLVIVFEEKTKANSYGPYKGVVGIPINFNGFVTGGKLPYKWYWSFGDGAYSISQNPTHTYNNEGVYLVSLRVADDNGMINIDYTTATIYPPDTLLANINGPNTLEINTIGIFIAEAIGGTPPYEYSWDNDNDGVYDIPKRDITKSWKIAGNYKIALKVTDSADQIAYDSITIIVENTSDIDITSPTITLTSPENGLYIKGNKVLSLDRPLIFFGITIKVSANDNIAIDHVKFYLDETIIFYDDEEPYEWNWNQPSFGNHNIKAIAVDTSGNSASTEVLNLWKFF